MGLFCLSPLIWQYAITAEVFPLNTMFAAIIIWMVQQFAIHRTLAYAYMGAFTCGLALCNQHTIVLYEAPLILWMMVLLRKRIYRSPALLLQLGMCFVLGLTPYLYLPIAASANHNAGSWGVVSTAAGFVHHVLRRDYGTFQLFSGAAGRNAEGFWRRTEAYAADFVNTQSVPVGAALVLLGVVGSVALSLWSARRAHPLTGGSVISSAVLHTPKKQRSRTATTAQKSTGVSVSAAPSSPVDDDSLVSVEECVLTPLALLLTQAVYFGVFHSLANLPLGDKLLFGVHQRFWMQPNVLMFVWLGVGFDGVVELVARLAASALSSSAVKSKVIKNTPEVPPAAPSSMSRHLVVGAGWAVAALLLHRQHQRWASLLDYSDNVHFRNYAAALLSPLPQGAVLLVNYDQQWTSVRYLQQCEGFRPDVTTIQLSMMTYKWFQHKRALYPHLAFPGTYHTYPGSPLIASDGAFSLLSFLDSNSAQHDVFLGGKVSYADEQMSARYDTVPVGLVSQFVPYARAPNGTEYGRMVLRGWEEVLRALSALPDARKYGEDTWEWTIGRDFKDRLIGERTLPVSVIIN